MKYVRISVCEIYIVCLCHCDVYHISFDVLVEVTRCDMFCVYIDFIRGCMYYSACSIILICLRPLVDIMLCSCECENSQKLIHTATSSHQ